MLTYGYVEAPVLKLKIRRKPRTGGVMIGGVEFADTVSVGKRRAISRISVIPIIIVGGGIRCALRQFTMCAVPEIY